MRAYSPLRYPGGKGQMYSYVDTFLKKNNLYGCNYIEPYAGGAGLALRLLFEDKVQTIAINDIDKSIYSFWYCVLYETDKFCERIEKVDITVEEWRKQKQIQHNKNNENLFNLGFSTFFLNRTNRSGILKAGPIGGYSQKGNYKIDCRFNKDRLIKLIKIISEYKKRIFIYNSDGEKFIKQMKNQNQFFFIDPPYYNKGMELYVNFFTYLEHKKLSETIKSSLLTSPFILTYDQSKEIEDMYVNLKRVNSELNYYLNEKKKANELLFYNMIALGGDN